MICSPWARLRVNADTAGAGISSLVECGREVDHFSPPEDLIQRRFEHTGYTDQLRFGWDDSKLNQLAMHAIGSRRDAGATRLSFAGTLDKGKGLQTTVSYVAYDDLPLITVERELFACSDQSDDRKDDGKPSEPIDDVTAVAMRFRAASRAETGDASGSRVLAIEKGKLRALRALTLWSPCTTRRTST